MIRRCLAALLMVLSSELRAETARVISGEHADFTRLVVELPSASDWKLGRTATGYEFRTTAEDQPSYDLNKVWDRIPRSRLSAVWPDPLDGSLRLTMSCPCHAFPFEYRPGMIVIDLRDGPPPEGSVFELPIDTGADLPPAIVEERNLDASVSAYDWLDRTTGRGTFARPPAELTLPTGQISLDPLRKELLEQISRGATEGMVEMALPGKPPKTAGGESAELPWSRIRIGEMPTVVAGTDIAVAEGTQPDGSACVLDAALEVAAWGTDDPGADQLAPARSGLLGEFDVPNPSAIKRTMKAHIFLGFGAEAIQYASLLEPAPADAEVQLYIDMARIVDGLENPASVFAPMLSCNGSAALWAALLHTRLPNGPTVNTSAIARSFAALPPHLRLHLGPGLAQKLLDRGDAESARMIRDAVSRTPWIPPEDVALLNAKADLSEGNLDVAALEARSAMAEGADGVDAILTIVEANFQKGQPLTEDVADTVRAFLRDSVGTPREAALRRALVLSLALSGQPAAAVTEAKEVAEVESDLWQVLAARATDDDFLTLAVLPTQAARPATSSDVATAVARRLVGLGFPEAGLTWIDPVDETAPMERRLIAARAEQARGGAGTALQLLSGLEGNEANSLRAELLIQLGTLAPAIEALRAAGQGDAAQRLITWEQDWERLQTDGPDAWREAASTIAPEANSEGGMLSQGTELLKHSESSRQAIVDLLNAVQPPDAEPFAPGPDAAFP